MVQARRPSTVRGLFSDQVGDVMFVRQAVTDPEVMTNLYAAFTTAGYVHTPFYRTPKT